MVVVRIRVILFLEGAQMGVCRVVVLSGRKGRGVLVVSPRRKKGNDEGGVVAACQSSNEPVVGARRRISLFPSPFAAPSPL
jgi:hypothetical protein